MMMAAAAAAAQSHDQSQSSNEQKNYENDNSPLQIISDIEPVADSTVSHMQELA